MHQAHWFHGWIVTLDEFSVTPDQKLRKIPRDLLDGQGIVIGGYEGHEKGMSVGSVDIHFPKHGEGDIVGDPAEIQNTLTV